MIDLLISLIVFCIVFGIAYYLISLIGLPEPFNKLVRVAFILIALLAFLGYAGGYFPEGRLIHRC